MKKEAIKIQEIGQVSILTLGSAKVPTTEFSRPGDLEKLTISK